jgi:hypothetical protein
MEGTVTATVCIRAVFVPVQVHGAALLGAWGAEGKGAGCAVLCCRLSLKLYQNPKHLQPLFSGRSWGMHQLFC